MSIVYIKKTKKYSELLTILNLMNLDVYGKRIFIKPNLVIPIPPSSGVITNPEIVRVLIKYLREKGAKEILIGELPAIGIDIAAMYKKSKYLKLAREEGVYLLNLLKEEFINIEWDYGTLRIPKIVKDSYYINVAKLKTHVQTTVTLGLKNQKGLLLDKEKKQLHLLGLHEPIAKLASYCKPNLTIIDGITGIQGDGPLTFGELIKSNVIVVSEDIVSADSAACQAMGIDPYSVKHIKYAFDLKVGDINPEINGDDVNRIKIKFKRANEVYLKFYKIKIWRNPCACSMCGDALKSVLIRIVKNPQYWFTIAPKIIFYTFFKGIDFIMGSNSKFTEEAGRLVIHIGNCTKEAKVGENIIFLEGCPPKAQDILKKLRAYL